MWYIIGALLYHVLQELIFIHHRTEATSSHLTDQLCNILVSF